MAEHRWQGYSHAELFAQINDGPGADGSTDSIRRWSELTRALDEIDSGLAAAVATARAGWRGEAATSAEGGLRPLGEWAAQAQQAAEVMRERAEQQAEHISKARRDMPPPVEAPAEEPSAAVTLLTHLFGGQTDYEVQEARQRAAEQRAFDVMRAYEASTRATTTSLASFTPPPQVVVDTPVGRGGASGAGQQVTISWGAPVTPTAPAPRAPLGSAPAGRGERSARNGSATGRGGSARHRDGTFSPTRRRTSGEQVDRSVTEQVGGRGGFFDEPQTFSRPVIGGEPG
ncbi:PPE domain-containing protein [Saccharopolyspora cebuensis]|uniref:PPE domain-containing protein n=1 Tax=Saccharopolyspora cebuensis TaxID=418759 RepID=A0ABV4CJN3_9PSEU